MGGGTQAEGERYPAVGVTAANRAPLYYQIFLVLQSQILNGEYAAGDYLPGERELSEWFGVSRITAMRVMRELAEHGLVVREQGRGTRVRPIDRAVVKRGPAADSSGGTVTVMVKEFAYEPANGVVAQALRLAPGDAVQRAVRVLRLDEAAFCQLVTFVPAAIGRFWTAENLAAASLQALLARAGHVAYRAEERVSATLTDNRLAQALETAVGAPLLHIVRTSFDEAGAPFEHLSGLFRPDLYRYDVSLDTPAQIRPVEERR